MHTKTDSNVKRRQVIDSGSIFAANICMQQFSMEAPWVHPRQSSGPQGSVELFYS